MLLSNLNLLATAPGGVARLRELILTLAVQGKLVPQDPADEPASVLLQKIRAEKDRLIAAKTLKREKNEPALTDEELPFELPDSWSWVALGEVVDIVRGITFPADQKTKEAALGRIACLRTSNVQQTIEWDDLLFVNRSFMGREDQLIQHHDIVMSMANSRELVGKVALIENVPHPEATFGGFLGVLRPRKIEPRYAMAVLRTPYARSLLIDSSSQTTNIANVSLAKLRPLPFPLPSEAEQFRIVTRVEELMRLCDALEAKGQLETTQHAQLVTALLGTLTASATSEELAGHWQRVAQHFDLLLDRPEAVDALEQTLLQLAVRGLLVPQDPTDEPANVLLARIRTEKDRLIVEGKIKRDKSLPPIADEEKPFELPVGWEWVRVGNIGVTQTGGTPASNRPEFFDGDFPFIGPGQITLTGKVLTPEKFISEGGRFECAVAEPGDILMVCIGGSIGKSAAATYATAFNQQINSLHPLLALNDYVLSAMTANDFVVSVINASAGSATPIISKGKWDLLLVPMPPLAEQSRIISRLAQMRVRCTNLRQRLTASQSTQSRLVVAIVSEVVAS